MKIEFTYWDRDQLHQILSIQEVARAPLGEVSDMMKLRDKLDVSDIEAEDTKKYELTISDQQIKRLHALANNPNIEWPISQHAVDLHERLSDYIEKVNGNAKKAETLDK